MVVFWKIRYLDRKAKTIHDRDLFLDTASLSPTLKAGIELVVETKTNSASREILRYRELFKENNTEAATEKWLSGTGAFNAIFLPGYFEDETGFEMTLDEIGQAATGDPTTRLIPSGARQHDIDFTMAEPRPLPYSEIHLSPAEVNLLGYFSRDLSELNDSAFKKAGPGTISNMRKLNAPSGDEPVLKTAATHEEIRSFVTIFRRLYMENEPANFPKAALVFEKTLGDHPYAQWIRGTVTYYKESLNCPPDVRPFFKDGALDFSTKRLIDVFLYTQYAHQPDEKRKQQYNECLDTVGGKKSVLAFMFLTEIWKCSLEMANAGRVICGWFGRYCEHHKVTSDVLMPMHRENPGIGSLEKESARQERIFREKTEELAEAIWNERGSPPGGSMQFLGEAEITLRKQIDG